MSARSGQTAQDHATQRRHATRASLSPDRSPWRRRLSIGLIVLVCVLTVFSAYAAYEVTSNFREVRAKASDDVDWSLNQVELESRDFTTALETAILDPEGGLARLRLRYDILYSRVTTLATSPVYLRLTSVPEFDAALERVHSFVIDTVPIIDAPDAELRAALPQLTEDSAHLRNDTRTLSLKGLTFFAEQADRQRAQVADTLLRLTGLIALLLVALLALVIHAFNNYRLARQHGQALTEANNRMSTILTTSLDGVLVTDGEGRLLEFNKACEDMFQYKFEDIRGQNVIDLIAPPGTDAIHKAAMERIRNGQSDHFAGRGRIRSDLRRADGTLFPGEISVEVAEEDGRPILLGFMHDISDRVAAEQELVKTRDQALAGERAKAEFLTVMSHEIRTPLNGMLGNLSLLNDTALTTAQTRYIRNMEISGRVLMRHVDTVLDIARHEAGVLNISLACTDLSVLLQELVDSQLSAASARGNALSWRWEGTPRAWVRTDRAALEQVLLNLIGNAIKFTNKGAITVEVEALPETIDDTPVIELRVCDTGIGIAEDRLDKVFEDFVTNDTGLGQVPGGTGLGLGIARRIVTAMGGTLGVESTEGQGSVFWVRLPMAPGRRPPQHAEESVPATAIKRRVLVVEDNAINRELAEEVLRNAGHEVIVAADGEQGLEQASVAAFDVILMDIAMPVMDGLMATLAIRGGNGPNKHTPIIAVSANILPTERLRLKEAGMNGFLAKPLDRAALQDTLHTLSTAKTSGEEDGAKTASVVVDIKTLTNNRSGLPTDTFARLLTRFLNEGDTLRDAIAAPDSDPATVAKMCHNLAGAAAVFGARSLHAQLVEADTAAKMQDSSGFDRALAAFPAIWSETRAALMDHLPSDAAE
ncbi:ATP-binding protein [Shimia sp. R9_3]|uniref:hybrid sensor histidine kinase/response regulator n=1 Tax=Shimia sp. R9_3 TaxID=2821113 RepID=UPI001ADD2118|nr:response regulator [Shimia sp. R9_3]